MAIFPGMFPVSAVVLPGTILTLVLVRLWSIRAQKKARLEMKRHLQTMEEPESV
jgi:hypothetical protein